MDGARGPRGGPAGVLHPGGGVRGGRGGGGGRAVGVTGRYAPSPTGELHLGNLRTALLAWLFARSAGGRFLVRIEDLDTARVRPGMAEAQLSDLATLGLDWDGDPVRQSGRSEVYADAIAELDARGLLYPCFCTRAEIREAASAPHGELPEGAYPGTCRGLSARERAEREATGRPPALRLRSDGERMAVEDRLHGLVEGVVDDFVIRRGDGTPSYQLAVVVDDAAQGVTEVVRADDLLDSTPRQAHLCGLLGVPPPSYAHVPLVVGPDGRRLAKRDGAVTLNDRTALGETPAQVLGMLAASLGLAEAGQEATPSELLFSFDPARLPREPAIWREPAGLAPAPPR